MDLSATKKEYKNFAEKLKETISAVRPEIEDTGRKHMIYFLEEFREINEEISPNQCQQIEMLCSFEPLSAVPFYRSIIHESIVQGLAKLAEDKIISEGLHEFLTWDSYLSPLTSYPVNSTFQLLFSQPFQRIYEDAYLLNGDSLELLSYRAAAIYKYFPDILFELFKSYPLDRELLSVLTNEMIFYWNVARTRFDLCFQLAALYIPIKENGNYRLSIDGFKYEITDLDNKGNVILPSGASKAVLVEGSTPQIFERYESSNRYVNKPVMNPFTCLRSSVTFEDMELPKSVPIKNILLELESKLAVYKNEPEMIGH